MYSNEWQELRNSQLYKQFFLYIAKEKSNAIRLSWHAVSSPNLHTSQCNRDGCKGGGREIKNVYIAIATYYVGARDIAIMDYTGFYSIKQSV